MESTLNGEYFYASPISNNKRKSDSINLESMKYTFKKCHFQCILVDFFFFIPYALSKFDDQKPKTEIKNIRFDLLYSF